MEELLAEKSAIESSRGGCIRQAGSPEVGFADVHGSSRNYASLDSGSFLCIQVVSPSKKKKMRLTFQPGNHHCTYTSLFPHRKCFNSNNHSTALLKV